MWCEERTALKSAFRGCSSIDGRDSSHSCATAKVAGCKEFSLQLASRSWSSRPRWSHDFLLWLVFRSGAHLFTSGLSFPCSALGCLFHSPGVLQILKFSAPVVNKKVIFISLFVKCFRSCRENCLSWTSLLKSESEKNTSGTVDKWNCLWRVNYPSCPLCCGRQVFKNILAMRVSNMKSGDPWRNGSASDSRSEGCVFDSRRVQYPETIPRLKF
jgi:hypothetical protein